MSQAQDVSVLERVIGTIDNATNLAPVNGVYSNIAENVEVAALLIEASLRSAKVSK